MSACTERELLLNALFDGELDAAHAAEMETHLATCAACQDAFVAMEAQRTALLDPALRMRASVELHDRLAASLASAAREPANSNLRPKLKNGRWPLAGAGAAIAAAACAAALVFTGPFVGDSALEQELIAGHVRSMQASHLIDVATSDQHVVKPWFSGKLDFSPPVVDLADQGFPIVGGRLDYIHRRSVAAVVYRRGRHLINLFIWPNNGGASITESRTDDGYTLLHWTQGGMTFWAVSDVNPQDLRTFERDVRGRAPS